MCKTVQRKRFFSTERNDSLPTKWEPEVRVVPGRSKSISDCMSQSTNRRLEFEIPDLGSYHGETTRQLHIHQGLSVASIISCLILAPLLGAVLYERRHDLSAMNQLKQEIAHNLHRLEELRDFKQAEIMRIPLYGDLDTKEQNIFLEGNRVETHQSIQLLSQRLLREKYGPGPNYRVEMRLIFDSPSDPEIVMLETASIDHMPHSVFHFLELVSHGVYDGTPFHRNAKHLIQAGPSARELNLDGLGRLLFQEYTAEMPHTEYTLGFPGRPGGPDFYINMQDNTKLHGPGGQSWHYGDIADEADPCFATVVQGRDVVGRIRANPEKHFVVIDKMQIIPATAEPADRTSTFSKQPSRSSKSSSR